MPGLCPASCTDITVIGNPTTNCTQTQRLLIPNRVFFYPCTVDLPDPIQGNIKPYFDDGTIAWSSSLRNFTLNDPTTQDIIQDDCTPPNRIISGREITFEDTAAITYGVGSPEVTNPFWDYAFWLDKINNQFKVRTMIGYCNGDVRIPIDSTGAPLTVSLLGFINYDAAGTAGGKRMEFKRLSLLFNGDPLGFNVTTAFNLEDEGIII